MTRSLLVLPLVLLLAGCGGGVDPTPSPTPTPAPDTDGDGVPDGMDCDESDGTIYGGAPEDGGTGTGEGDGKDNNCNNITDEGTRAYDDDDDGFSEDASIGGQSDCDDSDPSLYPGAPEIPYDNVDQDCDGFDLNDVDGDGYIGEGGGGDDCNDSDPTVNPTAPEDGGTGTNFGDGRDNNCDGAVDEGMLNHDDDGDTFSEVDGDCDDADPIRFPGQVEIPYDGIDQDCDFLDVADVDGDGHCQVGLELEGVPYNYELATCPAGAGDCADSDPTSFPGAPEACDGLDNNCDGQVPETEAATVYYSDLDSDGFGDETQSIPGLFCLVPSGYVAEAGDCDDSQSTVNPAAEETCNGVDDDCSGLIPTSEGSVTYFVDNDGDTFGDPENLSSQTGPGCSAPTGLSNNSLDCDDTDVDISPDAAEVCDGLDDNCDGLLPPAEGDEDFYTDGDGDGYGDEGAGPAQSGPACAPPEGLVTLVGDCDDTNAALNPLATEICDGIDDNCDGDLPEDEAQVSFYTDGDLDGYGDVGSGTTGLACDPPEGLVVVGGDCADDNPNVSPATSEVCNGTDDNCDGEVPANEAVGSYYADSDGDGYGGTASDQSGLLCQPPAGLSGTPDDCDDTNVAIYPHAPETCDGIDGDCDANTAETDDVDGDGAPACSPEGAAVDCNDQDVKIGPGSPDWRDDTLDNNCDGVVDGTTFTSRLTPYLAGDQSKARLGASLAGGQDLNDDGIDDLVVGSDSRDVAAGQDAGRVWISTTSPTGSALISDDALFVDGKKSLDYFGIAVQVVSDLNGDDLPDLIAGATKDDTGGNSRGAVSIFFGGADVFDAGLLASDDDVTLVNTSGFQEFGASIVDVGDFNGDGLSDIAVDAAGGRVALYLGREDWTDRTDATADLLLTGLVGTPHLAAGDIDGDGRSDLLIGDASAASGAGQVYILFGTGVLGDPESPIAEIANVTLAGSAGDKVGSTLASGQDLDDDGDEDLLIGTDDARGRIFFFSGRPRDTWIQLISARDSDAILTFPTSNNTSSPTGLRVLEDVSGDGVADLVWVSPGTDNAGTAYVVAGMVGGYGIQAATYDGAQSALLILKGLPAEQLGRGGAVCRLGNHLGSASGFAISAFGSDVGGQDFGQVFLIEGR